MQNQGFIPKAKDQKDDKNKIMRDNQNVYNYYGAHYFNPWFKRMENNKKTGEPKYKEEKNEITNQPGEGSQYQQMNYPMGGPSQRQQQFDPWGIGYGGFGYGFPPYGFHHQGGNGHGYGQHQNQSSPPPNEPQQQEQGEGEGNGYFDMPYYDPYFGYNYQFGQNQGGNNTTKKP